VNYFVICIPKYLFNFSKRSGF